VNEQQNQGSPTAQEILGLPQGCRCVLQRTMADYIFQMAASKRPEAAAALEVLNGQVATIVTANDDVIELRLDGPVAAPSGENLAVRLAREASGLFHLSISGAGTPPFLEALADLTVSREDERYVLASGEYKLRLTPRPGTVNIEAYTAPFLAQVPAILRAFAPDIVGLLSVTVDESLAAPAAGESILCAPPDIPEPAITPKASQ
jgi:hypothetical protein